MATDPLKRAMLRYAPQLTKDYKDFVKRVFKGMKKDLGPGLTGVRRSSRWAGTFSGISRLIDKPLPRGKFSFTPSEYDKARAVLNTARLNQEAKKYGAAVALEWYHKMQRKLGALTDVKVDLRGGGDVTIIGTHKGDKVRIEQQRIMNVSPLGTPFHQFPSRIYVNGKFVSEAQYKKLTPDVKRPPRKPKRAPIDPLTRPRSYHFEFKVDSPKTDYRSAVIGRRDSDDAKGMSEAEAWKKIHRRLMGYGWHSKVYAPVVVDIFAWNGRPLWRKSSGKPRPKGL